MSVAIAALADRNPEYLTHREIDATIALAPAIRWVGTDGASIGGYDGLWVVPGTPHRDEEAALEAIRFARERGMHADDAGVEGFELADHRFSMGTLFQPQVGTSERAAVHPLVTALVEAAA
jgi:CTP synthase (UTP-ammonia lyase)